MRLQAVLSLMVTLVFCSALSQWAPPTTTTLEKTSGAQAAKALYEQFKLQTNSGPSQSNLGSNPALSQWAPPTTTTIKKTSGAEAAKALYEQFKLHTNPGPSQSNLGSNPDPNVCYTENQEEGTCVKTSMCALPPPKIDATTLFIYKTGPSNQPANKCKFLMICCPIHKIRAIPVPPTARTPLGCGYSNPAAGRFVDRMGTSGSGYADFAEFPWMVALLKNSRNNPASVWHDTDYLGGGTLIHPSVVLTVAHKVDTMAPGSLKCRAGEWETENENESYEHQDREVQKILVHDQFDIHNAYYDVALLIMETPFLLKPHINVACLSTVMPPPGTLCYSMGWGMEFTKGKFNANVLKKIPMPLMPKHECERRFRKSTLGPSFSLHRSLTCAGGVPNVDTCTGDGGSSLVCPIGGRFELRYTVVGMVAYGMECGSEYPNAYAKIPDIYYWINQRMYMEGFYGMPYSI